MICEIHQSYSIICRSSFSSPFCYWICLAMFALPVGVEPTTNRLTVYCSTTELQEQNVRAGFYFYRLLNLHREMNYQITSNGRIYNILFTKSAA